MNTKLRGVSELGLFIGRDRTRPFLNLDGDFFNAKHLNGEGRVVAIDVWGVGGKASAEEQDNMRQWEDRQIEKSRKVKTVIFFFCVRSLIRLSYLRYRSSGLMKKKKRFSIWLELKHVIHKNNFKEFRKKKKLFLLFIVYPSAYLMISSFDVKNENYIHRCCFTSFLDRIEWPMYFVNFYSMLKMEMSML